MIAPAVTLRRIDRSVLRAIASLRPVLSENGRDARLVHCRDGVMIAEDAGAGNPGKLFQLPSD